MYDRHDTVRRDMFLLALLPSQWTPQNIFGYVAAYDYTFFYVLLVLFRMFSYLYC